MVESQRNNGNRGYSKTRSSEEDYFLRLYRELKGPHYNPLPHPEQITLAQRALEGDVSARNRILETYQRFVLDIAKSYTGQGLSIRELLSAGNLGLINSLRWFKPELGYRLTTYAVRAISRNIEKELRSHRNGKTISLDKVVEDQEPLIDSIPSTTPTPSEDLEREETYKSLEAALSHLSPKERQIIDLYFYKEISLVDIAKEAGVTPPCIGQIKKKALQKLRVGLES